MLTDRRTTNAQPLANAVIRLHQGAHCIVAARYLNGARCGAGTAFKFITNHAGSATNTTLHNRPATCTIKRRQHMLLADMEAIHIIEMRITGLCNYRQCPSIFTEGSTILVKHPARTRFMRRANTMSVGNANRAGEIARFVDPMGAGHFTITVQRKHRRPYWWQLVRMAARQDRSHAGPYRSFTNYQIPRTFNQSGVANLHARDIGKRIIGAAISGKW